MSYVAGLQLTPADLSHATYCRGRSEGVRCVICEAVIVTMCDDIPQRGLEAGTSHSEHWYRQYCPVRRGGGGGGGEVITMLQTL